MTRVLISPVGNRDPYADENSQEGSVVTICRTYGPEVVYLLPTARRPDVRSHTEDNARDTVDYLATDMPGVRFEVRPIDVANPTDFGEIVPLIDGIVARILDETAALPEREILLNASSGTPQIKFACLMLVATGALPARPLQVANPTTMTVAERIQTVDVRFIQERQIIGRVRDLFARHLFTACADDLRLLADATLRPERRAVALTFAEACDGYAFHDAQEYHRARQKLERAARRFRETSGLELAADVLRRQAKAAAELADGRDAAGFALAADIYHNARRRLDDERYVDAVARAWKVVEGALHGYLLDAHGVDGADLQNSPNREKVLRLADGLSVKPTARNLGYYQCTQALSLLGDERWRKWASAPVGGGRTRADEVESLRDARNRSIAGHGARAVDPTLAMHSVEVAEELVQFAFGRSPQDWPFAWPILKRVAEGALGAI